MGKKPIFLYENFNKINILESLIMVSPYWCGAVFLNDGLGTSPKLARATAVGDSGKRSTSHSPLVRVMTQKAVFWMWFAERLTLWLGSLTGTVLYVS